MHRAHLDAFQEIMVRKEFGLREEHVREEMRREMARLRTEEGGSGQVTNSLCVCDSSDDSG